MSKDDSDISNQVMQLRKGVIEYALMIQLQTKSRYTGEIIKAFKHAGLDVVEGTLYPMLSRLAKQGIVEYYWEEAKTGHPRKYYTLTIKGKDVLKALKKTWNNMNTAISAL